MTSTPGPEFWSLIRPYTGAVTHHGPPPDGHGFSTDVLLVVECENGSFFLKGMRNRPGGRRDQMVREGLINPFVRSVSPELMWSTEDEHWIVLAFERVHAREAAFDSHTGDLPTIVGMLNQIGRLELPDIAREWHETRWDWWADAGTTDLFRGDTLLHADINPSNFLICERRSWIVDWSWPTRGAAFIDPAMLVLQLVADAHTPQEAESWAARCPAWVDADPKAIDAFVVAYTRMNRHRALRRPEEPWLRAMFDATHAWATHRGLEY
ncbi:hypothetical protein [Streptomyces sedi]|uniref:Protein kinase n=1 Tax=Streptomyces sedi TaxID=555059 RepID=A0A5C4VE68_9ACTN|nr:hypothetical protein [Streptomyces sedi]TNM33349.1 hypothetical protein FH715_02990 [Streptomyces sedi]